jgi:hypothetical protein
VGLQDLAIALAAFEDRHFQVVGHSDTTPIHTPRFPSNWELSSQRALEVVKVLVDAGVPPQMLSGAGSAHFDPLVDDTTTEAKAMNRRVEIVFVPNMSELSSLGLVTPDTASQPTNPTLPRTEPGASEQGTEGVNKTPATASPRPRCHSESTARCSPERRARRWSSSSRASREPVANDLQCWRANRLAAAPTTLPRSPVDAPGPHEVTILDTVSSRAALGISPCSASRRARHRDIVMRGAEGSAPSSGQGGGRRRRSWGAGAHWTTARGYPWCAAPSRRRGGPA